MPTPTCSPEHTSSSYHTAPGSPMSHVQSLTPSPTSTTQHACRTVAFGESSIQPISPRHTSQETTATRRIRQESAESNYTQYYDLYTQIAQHLHANDNCCLIWLKNKFPTSGLKAHLIDKINPSFHELKDTPRSLAEETGRLCCLIHIVLIVYGKYKELCMNQDNQLASEYNPLFSELDLIHQDLFQSIRYAIRSKRQSKTGISNFLDIFKKHDFSEELIIEHFPAIHRFYLREMVERANHYRQNYQTFYPKFLIDLLAETKSEDQVFTRLRLQSSIDSSDTSVHSGSVIIDITDKEDPVFHGQE